jgi:threonine synthase
MIFPLHHWLPTPLVPWIAPSGQYLYLKIEAVLPTGSHKDRESIAVCAQALQEGHDTVGVASTGNSAISLAVIARSMGLRCCVYTSATISHDRLARIQSVADEVHALDGDYPNCLRLSSEDMSSRGIFNSNPGRCPSRLDSGRTIAAEAASSLPERIACVYCPSNNATLAAGLAVGLDRSGTQVIGIESPGNSIAASIAPAARTDRRAAENNGVRFDTVSSTEVQSALATLRDGGIVVEGAAAAPVAAALRIPVGVMKGPVVCVVTAGGFRFL